MAHGLGDISGLTVDQLVHEPASDTWRIYCREGEGEWEWREVSAEEGRKIRVAFQGVGRIDPWHTDMSDPWRADFSAEQINSPDFGVSMASRALVYQVPRRGEHPIRRLRIALARWRRRARRDR